MLEQIQQPTIVGACDSGACTPKTLTNPTRRGGGVLLEQDGEGVDTYRRRAAPVREAVVRRLGRNREGGRAEEEGERDG